MSLDAWLVFVAFASGVRCHLTRQHGAETTCSPLPMVEVCVFPIAATEPMLDFKMGMAQYSQNDQ